MLCSLGDGSLIAPTAAGRTTTAKSAATRSKNGRPDCGLLEFVFMGSEYSSGIKVRLSKTRNHSLGTNP